MENDIRQGSKAIVIGGSIAGMLAARILAEKFEQVTVLERDWFPEGPEKRNGIPQARHIHVLLQRGQEILDGLFPGMTAGLVEQGAPTVDWIEDCQWASWRGLAPRFPSDLKTVTCSRDLLEYNLRNCLKDYPGIQFIQGCEATGLLTDMEKRRAAGVRAVRRDLPAGDSEKEFDLPANLVVDASGRSSRATDWLKELGFLPPQETVVNPFQGYATRWYLPPPGFHADWKIFLIRSHPPVDSHAGGIYVIEGGRWIVTLGGSGKDYPPTDEEGFLAFARSLSCPVVYEAIRVATPISPIYGFRKTENRWRHYESMEKRLEGFLVTGDAACTFNPVYGQGMTAAALGALALGQCLERTSQGSLDGLAGRFQKKLAASNRQLWTMATGEDYRWTTTEGERPGNLVHLLHWYFDQVLDLAIMEPDLHLAFGQAAHLVKPAAILFRPKTIWRVARHALTDAGKGAELRARPCLPPNPIS